MALVALVTVPDEGAAEVVRAALTEVDIPVELQRATPDHPYRASVLAAPWRVMVPQERLEDAQLTLERVQKEMAEEVDAQAGGYEGRPEGDDPVASPDPARRPLRISWALALGVVLVVPVVCFYARARRQGAFWLGLFLLPLVLLVSGARFLPAVEPALSPLDTLLLIAVFAKLADLFVGLLLIGLGRRSTSPA